MADEAEVEIFCQFCAFRVTFSRRFIAKYLPKDKGYIPFALLPFANFLSLINGSEVGKMHIAMTDDENYSWYISM